MGIPVEEITDLHDELQETKTHETFTVRELNGLLGILTSRGETKENNAWVDLLKDTIAVLLKNNKQEIILDIRDHNPEVVSCLREMCNNANEYYKAKNFYARFGNGRR